MGFFLSYETKSCVGGGSSAILFPVRTSQQAAFEEAIKTTGLRVEPGTNVLCGVQVTFEAFQHWWGFTPYRKLGFADSFKILFIFIKVQKSNR